MDEDHRKTIAKNLRNYMYLREKTQAQMARDLSISKATISCWMNGTRIPRMDAIEKLCSYLRITKAQLLEDEKDFISVPVYGQVAAGIPMEMIEDITDTEDIPKAMTRGGKQYFALKIHGNSMEPRMRDGDVIIVRKQPDAEDGEIVVAAVNGDDATCKRLKKYKDAIALLSTNPDYDPIYISKGEKPVTILGKVVELRAKFE